VRERLVIALALLTGFALLVPVVPRVSATYMSGSLNSLIIGWQGGGGPPFPPYDPSVMAWFYKGTIFGTWYGSETSGAVQGTYSINFYYNDGTWFASGSGTISGTYSTFYDPNTGVMSGTAVGTWSGTLNGVWLAYIGVNVQQMQGILEFDWPNDWQHPTVSGVPLPAGNLVEFWQGDGIWEIAIIEGPLPPPITKEISNIVDRGDGDGAIEVNERIVWTVTITATNTLNSPMSDVVVEDRFGAELRVRLSYVTKGTVTIATHGETRKVSVTWDVGGLASGEPAILVLTVYTDLNPAGHQEYTSPGKYELNSGCVLKGFVAGKRVSFETDPIAIVVT